MAYGITVWGQASTYIMERIQRIQRGALRNIKRMVNSDVDIFKETMLLPVNKLYIYRTVINKHKTFSELPTLEHGYDTRGAARGNLEVSLYSNKYECRCDVVTLPRIFNALPLGLRGEVRIGVLKARLRSWLLERDIPM